MSGVEPYEQQELPVTFTEPDPKPGRQQESGWEATTKGDLIEVLYGDDDGAFTGYMTYERATDLSEDLGVELEDHWREPSEFLKEVYEKYEILSKNRKIVFYNHEERDDENDGYTAIPAKHRGTAEYQAEKGDLFDALETYMESEDAPGVHLRLSPRMPEGVSPVETLKKMSGMTNKFMSALEYHVGESLDYVWVMEPTEKGHPHFHVLFPNISFLCDKAWIDEWWRKNGFGTGAGVWIERLSGREAGKKFKNYLIKYMNKECNDEKWLGLLFLTRKQTFQFSSDLRDDLVHLLRVDSPKEESDSQAVLLGVLSVIWDEIEAEEGDYLPPPVDLYEKYISKDPNADFEVGYEQLQAWS